MIYAENLHKYYRNGKTQTHVLKGVSLEIGQGSFTAILGASGSGKSTLLSLLSGLEAADEGTLVCRGETLSGASETERTLFRKKYVGFVFQQYFLLPHLNVEQNVKMGAALSGSRDWEEIVEAVGLAEKRKNYPAELSGGEQQRVSIARALAKQPEILFLDEPTGALDEETGRSVLDFLLNAKKQHGITMIMVTHNANVAETADAVLRMNSGRIAEAVRNAAPKSAYEIGW